MNPKSKLFEFVSPDCIQQAQLGALSSSAWLIFSSNLAVSSLLLFLLWGSVNPYLLTGWFLAVVMITSTRFMFLRDFHQAAHEQVEKDWHRWVVVGALIAGFVWGVAALMLFPTNSLPHQLIVVCTLIGMMAGSAVLWNVYLPAVASFIFPVAGLLMVRLSLEVMQGGELRWLFVSLLLLAAIFTLALYVFARNASQSFCRLVQQTERSISGERYKLLFDGAHIPMMLIDPQSGQIVDANGMACSFYGYSEDQLKTMTVVDLEAVPDGVDFPYTGDSVCYHQLQQRTSIGQLRTVEVYFGPVQMGDLKVLFYVIHDITSRNEMEQLLKLSKLQLRTILDNMPFMAWLKDVDGRFLEVNELHARSTGLGSPANVIGKTDADIWPWDLADKYRSDDLNVMQTRQKIQAEEIGLDEGLIRWYQTVKVPVIGHNGEVAGTAGYARDITELRRTEESQRLAAAIYQASSEAIMVTNEHNLIVDVNPAFTRITGYALSDVKGKNPSLLQSGKHDKAFYEQFWHSILTLGYWHGELWDRRKNGDLYAKWVNITRICRDDGSVMCHVAQFSEITEKKKQDELTWQHANFDSLTGLPNRRLFRNRLEQEIKKARRASSQLALLFIDLDRFKQVNDTLGHDKGDALLVEAATRIAACVRETDTVSRLGGDEFTVILPDFGDVSQLERISRQIAAELSLPFIFGNDTAHISASIGMTLYSGETDDAESMLRQADQSMYAVKAQGREH